MPFVEMGFYRWGSDRRAHSRWRLQVASVVWFLKAECGRDGVRVLLKARGDGKSLDAAPPSACPGRWADATQFELAWRESIAASRRAAALASR